MKALLSILDPQNRIGTNTCFVFAHDFVLAVRYLLFFSLLTYITDSAKFLRCLLYTDGRSQLQYSDTSTKSVKRRMLKHRKWRGKINGRLTPRQLNGPNSQRREICFRPRYQSICSLTQFVFSVRPYSNR